MWKSKRNWIFYLLIFLLFAVSCKTKQIRKTAIERESFLIEQEYTTFNVPKATFTLVKNKNATSVNGSIRILKDSIIILSIQPLLGIEVARAGITQNSFTLVDRFNKRYFTADFDSLRAQTGVNLNYNIFQSVFTGSLFVFDNPGRIPGSVFEEVQVGDLTLLQINRGNINQEFNVNEKRQVQSGRLFTNDDSYSVGWSYLNFTSLESGHIFPHLVKIILSGGTEQYQLDVAYNKVELNKNLNFQFSVPSSYTQVTLEELLKILQ
jgi:hypothetical protein